MNELLSNHPAVFGIGVFCLLFGIAVAVTICCGVRGKTPGFMAANDFSAETITGSNEREGSEMPAERNGDCLSRLTDARHACAGNFNNKAAR
jgi:hypothetical protein